MRILIVGAGALGGYFGARLLAAQRDVTFLLRPASAALLAANGIQLTSPRGNLSLAPPPAVLAENLTQPYDLILLSCKAHDLPSAMENFAPAVGPNTAILPLLNGLAHIETLDHRFGPTRVLGGATTISAVRDPDGRIRHLNNLDTLLFGDREHPGSSRIESVAETLNVPGFEALLRPNIMQDMWNKWISIATTAGITCLMRATIGDIVSVGAAPLVGQLLTECASISTAQGFPPTARYLEVILAKFTEPGSAFTASMLRDMESGNPIESDPIIGDLLVRAHTHQLSCPLLGIVYAHLCCHQARQAREAAFRNPMLR